VRILTVFTLLVKHFETNSLEGVSRHPNVKRKGKQNRQFSFRYLSISIRYSLQILSNVQRFLVDKISVQKVGHRPFASFQQKQEWMYSGGNETYDVLSVCDLVYGQGRLLRKYPELDCIPCIKCFNGFLHE